MDGGDGRSKTYWILTTPRSGSNFIAGEIRRRLGGLPLSGEFFNADIVRVQAGFAADRHAPVRSYLDYLRSHYGIGGILGVKMIWRQVEECCRYPDFLPALAGGGIVFLRRRNVVRQGISHFIAARTKSWTSAKQPTLVHPADLDYDRDAIAYSVDRMELHNALLQRFLLVHAFDHLPVWYEDFVADPDGESERILAHLGLERSAGPLSDIELFRVQATDRNDEFYERFLEDERRALRGDGSYRGPPLFPEEPRGDTPAHAAP